MPVVDHQSTAATFLDQLDEFNPSTISGQTDLGAITARPPPVRPRELLTLQSRSRLLQTIITDDHLAPAVGVSNDYGARQVIQPFRADDHDRPVLIECGSGLAASPASVPDVP